MVPIYLGEISPPAFRASFGGLAYQLGMAEFHLEVLKAQPHHPQSHLPGREHPWLTDTGNMASSAAAQIEATAGETLKLEGTTIPDYVSPFSARNERRLIKGDDPSDLDWSSHRLDAPYDTPRTRE